MVCSCGGGKEKEMVLCSCGGGLEPFRSLEGSGVGFLDRSFSMYSAWRGRRRVGRGGHRWREAVKYRNRWRERGRARKMWREIWRYSTAA